MRKLKKSAHVHSTEDWTGEVNPKRTAQQSTVDSWTAGRLARCEAEGTGNESGGGGFWEYWVKEHREVHRGTGTEQGWRQTTDGLQGPEKDALVGMGTQSS